MVHLQKNLLEAFRDAESNPATPPPSAGPFVEPAPPEAHPPEPAARSGRLPLPLLALFGLALFASGVLIGRLSMASGEVRAEEPAPAAGGDADGPWFEEPAAPVTPPAVAPGAGGAVEPLMDPRNRFTSIAIQYGRGPENDKLARATRDYLRANGFQDCWAYEHKDTIFVFVGASPNLDAIQAVVKRLQKTPGPGGKKDFGEAFAVNIDYQIKR